MTIGRETMGKLHRAAAVLGLVLAQAFPAQADIVGRSGYACLNRVVSSAKDEVAAAEQAGDLGPTIAAMQDFRRAPPLVISIRCGAKRNQHPLADNSICVRCIVKLITLSSHFIYPSGRRRRG